MKAFSLNAATGNLLLSHRDEFLVGRGPDIGISRTYNSLGALDENGDNWRQSTDRRILGLTGTVNTTGSTITRVSADGSEIVYTYDAAKQVYLTTEGAGAHDQLVYNSSKWTWTDGDSQYTEIYDNETSGTWRIHYQKDSDGNTLTFTYVGTHLNRITTFNTNNSGGYIEYSWDGNNITSILTGYTDLDGGTSETLTRVTYTYDGQNRLTKVTNGPYARNPL